MYNISYLEVPLQAQGLSSDGKKLDLSRFDDCKLKDNMYITAQPLYKSIQIDFFNLHTLVKSDYRQISPFEYKDGIKKTENWSNENMSLLVLDIDDGLSVNEAKKMFADYKYLIYTTKSHQVDKKGKICDRFRIILASDNIPKGDKYFVMMRVLEERMPFIDKQVNNKTGAFLGNFDCEYWYNNGKDFDCKRFLDAMEVDTERVKIKPAPVLRNAEDVFKNIDVSKVTSALNRELVSDIVSSLGYEVNRQFKFRYRAEERTPSASINSGTNPLIKDFGGSFEGDAIEFVREVKRCTFAQAVEYVARYANVAI